MNEKLLIVLIMLAISVILNLILLAISIRFTKITFSIEDKLNNASEILSNSEMKISKILKTPLFFDSPEIKSTLNSIKEARNSLIDVAGELEMIDKDE